MSRSLNRVQLIGNTGGDPEVRTLASGVSVARFSLATNRTWKNRKGEEQEETQWHRLVLWERLADIARQYVRKGDRLYVEGRIEYGSYVDDAGVTRYTTEIRVFDMVMLGGAKVDAAPPWDED